MYTDGSCADLFEPEIYTAGHQTGRQRNGYQRINKQICRYVQILEDFHASEDHPEKENQVMSTTTPSTGISTTSMFLTPQAVDDFESILEGSVSVFTFDVMRNDLGGNAKTLYAITDGPEWDIDAEEIADLQSKDINGVFEASALGAKAAIVNGKIVYNTAEKAYPLWSGNT